MNSNFYKQAVKLLSYDTVLLCPKKEPIFFDKRDCIKRVLESPEHTYNNTYVFLWDSNTKRTYENYNPIASKLRGFDMYGNVIAENKHILMEERVCFPDSHY